jgi:ABC-type sugar transport system substrate-binding protein
MQKTKVIIALAAVAALTLALVGLAAAQAAQNQYYTNPAPNTQGPGNGFWGWIGNCFGYRAAQGYQGQYVAPPVGVNATAPEPYQDGYGYGYGYGPCWAWR